MEVWRAGGSESPCDVAANRERQGGALVGDMEGPLGPKSGAQLGPGQPGGVEGRGTALSADRGIRLSSLKVMPKGVVLIGGFHGGLTW